MGGTSLPPRPPMNNRLQKLLTLLKSFSSVPGEAFNMEQGRHLPSAERGPGGGRRMLMRRELEGNGRK